MIRAVSSLLLLVALQQLGSAGLIQFKAWLAPVLIEAAWNRSDEAGRGSLVRPWPWADTWPVARLRLPDQGIERYVLHGASGHALAFGPAHDHNMGALGSTETAVIAGHRDTHFAFLETVEPGTQVELALGVGRVARYRVAQTRIVDSALGVLPDLDARGQLLLVTCYPFDAVSTAGTLRYVVQLVPAEAAPLQPEVAPSGSVGSG